LLIDTVVCLTLAKWETVSGRFGGYLNPSVSFSDQILVLIASAAGSVGTEELLDWIECKDRTYFKRLLRKLHDNRMLNLSKDGKHVHILPLGTTHVSDFVRQRTKF
jgi:hypothetical protein